MKRPSLSERLVRLAAGRLRADRPEWAEAMIAEHQSIAGAPNELAWAVGAVRASLSLTSPDPLYMVALPLAIVAMSLYQWSADESLVTVGVLTILGACLGFVRPRRVVLSGVALGAVVTVVNGFETISGLRPGYETHAHTLLHDLRWLVLIVPALAGAGAGRRTALALASTHEKVSRCR